MISETAEMPRRAEPGSAGYDFYAPEDIHLVPGKWTTVDTGVRFDGTETVLCPISEMTLGGGIRYVDTTCDTVRQWAMMVFPRSGLGFKYGVRFSNTVGLIDMTYRDTIKAKMTCEVECTIRKGERFMQGVIVPFGIFNNELKPIHEERSGGFGSTGQ